MLEQLVQTGASGCIHQLGNLLFALVPELAHQ